MRQLGVALLAMSCAPVCSAAACGVELRGAQTVESPHYRIAYRAQPAKIEVSRPFAIELVICAKGEVPPAQGVAVDAYMPEHAHGMNYKPTVVRVPSAKSVHNPRFRADGLLFHMPGRWDITFDVTGTDGSERLTRSIVLE